MLSQSISHPGFMLFFEDWEVATQLMTPEEFHEYFMAVFRYARDEELPNESEHSVTFNAFFNSIRHKLDKNIILYAFCPDDIPDCYSCHDCDDAAYENETESEEG